MSDADVAQLLAGLVLALLILVLAMVHRTDRVAEGDAEFELANGTRRSVTHGTVIPQDQLEHIAETNQAVATRERRRSALGAILVGKDHRTSTSKTVVFAWTIAVAFGLLSLLVAVWLGDHDPWDAQVDRGLQEEYLLLLGGPFAAAILAKYAATTQDDAKTDAPVGNANASQLVNDDEGNADLGDFQYVLFNLIALAFFFGDFIGDLSDGFPALPAILTGLILTSTGGYAAKKLIAQAGPTMATVTPSSAAPDSDIQIFGANLDVPASVSATAQRLDPTVLMGSQRATVKTHDLVLGNNRLTVTVPNDAKTGPAPISIVRADGVAARGPAGLNLLPFEVAPVPIDAMGDASGQASVETDASNE
jgi:hypothetical protein